MSRPRCARRARAIAETYSGAANQATEAWVGRACFRLARALAQWRADVDHALVLDRDEVGADSHRHFLDVREDLVADLLRVVADANFDSDLVHRLRVEPGLA